MINPSCHRVRDHDKRTAVLAGIVICLSMLSMFSGCASDASVTRDGFLLDTTVSVTLYDPADKSLLDGSFDLIRADEKLFSRTIEGSDVWNINHAGGKPVNVSDETADILTLCTKYSKLSGGAFDVTIEPVSSLWNFTSENPTLPDTAALKAAVQLVDYRQLTVIPAAKDSPFSVQLSNSKAAVDLGGIAKGYIADHLHQYLTEHNVKSALINLGGNIYAVGTKKGKPWTIGVRNPSDSETISAKLSVTDSSVVTSGTYERCFTLDGVLYHHILDPSTGQPVRNGLASVTIVCANSAQADALSTACFVLGKEKGLALIESLPDTEALFIDDDGNLTASPGLKYTIQ